MQGPRLKKIRRLGTPLPGLSRKAIKWKSYAPGAHGATRRRRPSEYLRQLEEKQKVRWHYGISEGQLRRAFERATREPGATGERLLVALERRMDNVVFRLGFAPTIPAARQLVSHGHVMVNGGVVDRAGYRLASGAEVMLTERGRAIPDVEVALARGPEVRLPSYLALDPSAPYRGRMIAQPTRADIPLVVDEAAIVEFYAR